MSQTVAPVVSAPGPLDGLRAGLEGTPGRLRAAAVAAVLACLVFALLGGSAFQARGNALADARSDAEQLVRVQAIATDLVKANSDLTNGYLAYGSETAENKVAYRAAIADAAARIAQAAAANPADAQALAAVNQALAQYQTEVANARFTNNQGEQVGTGYLRRASDLLLNDQQQPNILPTLRSVAAANTQRVDAAFTASQQATLRLIGAAVVGLGVLLAVQLWLARRTRRVLNVPLAAATVGLLVAVVVGGVAMAGAQSSANKVKNNSYAATLALSNARIASFLGKSYESLALIYVGTGGDYTGTEKLFQQQVTSAASALQQAQTITGLQVGSPELAAWKTQHAANYTTSQTNWAGAKKTALLTTKDAGFAGSANASFQALADASESALTNQAAAVTKDLGASHTSLLVMGWLALVLGLLAAGAAWWGISIRLEEYR